MLDLVTFTEDILNENFIFCAVVEYIKYMICNNNSYMCSHFNGMLKIVEYFDPLVTGVH